MAAGGFHCWCCLAGWHGVEVKNWRTTKHGSWSLIFGCDLFTWVTISLASAAVGPIKFGHIPKALFFHLTKLQVMQCIALQWGISSRMLTPAHWKWHHTTLGSGNAHHRMSFNKTSLNMSLWCPVAGLIDEKCGCFLHCVAQHGCLCAAENTSKGWEECFGRTMLTPQKWSNCWQHDKGFQDTMKWHRMLVSKKMMNFQSARNIDFWSKMWNTSQCGMTLLILAKQSMMTHPVGWWRCDPVVCWQTVKKKRMNQMNTLPFFILCPPCDMHSSAEIHDVAVAQNPVTHHQDHATLLPNKMHQHWGQDLVKNDNRHFGVFFILLQPLFIQSPCLKKHQLAVCPASARKTSSKPIHWPWNRFVEHLWSCTHWSSSPWLWIEPMFINFGQVKAEMWLFEVWWKATTWAKTAKIECANLDFDFLTSVCSRNTFVHSLWSKLGDLGFKTCFVVPSEGSGSFTAARCHFWISSWQKQQQDLKTVLFTHKRADDHPPKRFTHDPGEVSTPLKHHGEHIQEWIGS